MSYLSQDEEDLIGKLDVLALLDNDNNKEGLTCTRNATPPPCWRRTGCG